MHMSSVLAAPRAGRALQDAGRARRRVRARRGVRRAPAGGLQRAGAGRGAAAGARAGRARHQRQPGWPLQQPHGAPHESASAACCRVKPTSTCLRSRLRRCAVGRTGAGFDGRARRGRRRPTAPRSSRCCGPRSRRGTWRRRTWTRWRCTAQGRRWGTPSRRARRRSLSHPVPWRLSRTPLLPRLPGRPVADIRADAQTFCPAATTQSYRCERCSGAVMQALPGAEAA
jgi:hypothetical protein